MARPPLPEHDLNTQFGPHPNYEPPGGWDKATDRPPDKLVKTHCSFLRHAMRHSIKGRATISWLDSSLGKSFPSTGACFVPRE